MVASDILVDPFVFVIPQACTGKADWEDYFERLVRWGTCLRNEDCTTSENAIGAAQADGVFPTFDTIARAIKQFAIDSFSTLDITNALRVLSERAPFIEARIALREVVGGVSVTPSAIATRLPNRTSKALVNILGCLALNAERSASRAPTFGTHSLFNDPTDEIPNPELTDEVLVRCQLELVESYDGECTGINPASFILSFDVIQDPEGLVTPHCTNWNKNPLARIQEHCRALASQGAVASKTAIVALGEGFLSSIEKLTKAGDVALLDRALRYAALASLGVLKDTPGAKLHPVRESEGADAPQLQRHDGARKWRCMVSKRGAGYRLQFWTLSDGSVELSEVVAESVV